MPESLLTAALVPQFECALPKDTEVTQTVSMTRGALPQLRKPPSLSTLAMPSFAGQRTMSSETVSKLAALIAQLPIENRDLLYTVVELVSATAARSKETKMPLGNLMLLFCPTLGVSHTLLRVLCEARDIWNPPAMDTIDQGESRRVALDQTSAPSPTLNSINSSSSSLLSDSGSDSDVSDLPVGRVRPGRSRGPSRTLLFVPSGAGSPYSGSSTSGSGQDDAASYMSALDHSPAVSNDSSNNLPALTTSTDSIATPSTMSEVSSLQQHAPGDTSVDENVKEFSGCAQEEPNVIDLSLPTAPRRPFISTPVPFPTSGSSSPHTPSSTRKSIALLSFPPLGKSDSSPSSPGGSAYPTHRPKRPSLTLLFSKRSMSSLSSPAVTRLPERPVPSRSSSLQTPIPPTAAISLTPPLLDTPISSSPIRLFDATGELTIQGLSSQATSAGLLVANEADWQGRERKDSSGSSLFSTPQQTPIADFFRGRSASLISVLDVRDTEVRDTTSVQVLNPLAASPSIATPSISVGLDPTPAGNWTNSVLEEARASVDSVKPT